MGRFRLREQIGSGGMGVVYRAFDERLRRDVAVKEVAAGDPERVLREAQAAARLNHPGIVTVYELGRRGGSALLVSELVEGTTLAEARAQGTLCDRDVAEIGIDLCEALAHAHAHGVVHRDIKPQNAIVSNGSGRARGAKLVDFGIARLAGAPTLTAAGEVVGTLAYMAPEQAEGLAAGPEADAYSLGLTLYECWAGANPVAGRTPAATARRIGEPVESLSAHRPDLDPVLIAAIDACLAVDPGRRPSVGELRDRLRAARATLDPARALPATGEGAAVRRLGSRLGLARIAGALALAGALAALWGPVGAPGAALVAGVLIAPAIIVLPGLGPGVPPLAGLLGIAGAIGAYPAAAAHAGATAAQRALAGALGWWWALALAIALGPGSTLGIAPAAPAGWEASSAGAAAAVLAPLVEPAALAGAAGFAAAAAALGWILRAPHIAVATLGALLWAAALAAGLGLVADGSLGDRPALAALAAAAAVAIEHARRIRI